MTSTVFTEAVHPGAFIVSEEDAFHCRQDITIPAGVAILVGQVLGKLLPDHGTVSVGAPAFTGTGNGTLTRASPAYGAGVQEGTYKVRLIEAGGNAGSFEVFRPDGTLDGIAEVGVAYDGQVKFTIADGGTDFSAAAQFTLAVSIPDPTGVGSYNVLDPAAADGTQVAAAIAIYPLAAAADYRHIAAWVRGPAQYRASDLAWPAGITADQKAAAVAQLSGLGIIGR